MENYKNSKIGQETAQKYGDIIEMERPQTEESLRKHPRMTLQNRAKIFSPFAALRGYDEQLAAEKQRTERVPKRILTEEEMSALSDRLMQVTKGMTITVRYFKEDTAHPEIPAVGNYIMLTGKADRIDPVFCTLQVGDTVQLTNLWETLTYTVTDIQIIQPQEVEKIKIQPNRDLLTLLTCHPYASGGRQRHVVVCERVVT